MSDITISPYYEPISGMSSDPAGAGGGDPPYFDEFLDRFQSDKPLLPGRPILGPDQPRGEPNSTPGGGEFAGGFGPPAALPKPGGQIRLPRDPGRNGPIGGPFGPPDKLPG